MNSLYKDTEPKLSFPLNGRTHWEVRHSGARPKTILCPRCQLSKALLSFKFQESSESKALGTRTYAYACKACGLEYETKSLTKKNSMAVARKKREINATDFIVSILKVHNKKGSKDVRQTADFIEKTLHLKRGWVSKKINQRKNCRLVDPEIISDIEALALSL